MLSSPVFARMGRLAALLVMLGALAACQPSGPLPPNATLVPVESAADVRVAQAATPLPTAVSPEIVAAADAEYLLLTNLYARVAPSVVNIEVVLSGPQTMLGGASGSGFVYDTDGHLITNSHVVNDAEHILITFSDGFIAEAEVVGLDSYSDLAVLRVDAERVGAARLLPVTFADSASVRVGQRAIAIGNPFGLTSSMTQGIVSGLGRQLPSAELAALGGAEPRFQNPDIIQVDAPINPGNSGGPLLNSAGEVIGVNTAIRSQSGVFEGVGFAVPTSTVLRVVPELIAAGRVSYSYIGVTSQSSEFGYSVASLAGPLELSVQSGVLVADVTPGSPAERAGLRGGSRQVEVYGRSICAGGDIIVAVNGEPVDTMDALVSYLVLNTQPGDTVTLRVLRGEAAFDLPVVLEARPASVEARPSCSG